MPSAKLPDSSEQKYCFPFAYFDAYARSKALDDYKREEDDYLENSDKRNINANDDVKMLYPYWSLLMGHKAMLPIIYERNPDHPNLLPTYFHGDQLAGVKHIVKRANSAQGIGSKIVSETGTVIASRHFDARAEKVPYRHVYQKYSEACADTDGGYRVFHMFTANGQAAALGTRVAPGSFVGGDDTKTNYMPVIVRGDNRTRGKPGILIP